MRFFATFLLLPAVAFGVTVESLPQSEYADTEVSTNIPFEVSFNAMSRMNFSISLEASLSNCIEVSIGKDANADGNLSLEEAAYAFGFECGRWFKRSAADDSETSETDNCGQTVFEDEDTFGRCCGRGRDVRRCSDLADFRFERTGYGG